MQDNYQCFVSIMISHVNTSIQNVQHYQSPHETASLLIFLVLEYGMKLPYVFICSNMKFSLLIFQFVHEHESFKIHTNHLKEIHTIISRLKKECQSLSCDRLLLNPEGFAPSLFLRIDDPVILSALRIHDNRWPGHTRPTFIKFLQCCLLPFFG